MRVLFRSRIGSTLHLQQDVGIPDFKGVAGGNEEGQSVQLAQLFDHGREDDPPIVVIAKLFGRAELPARGVVALGAEIVAAAAVELFVEPGRIGLVIRSEEHKSELQSLMRRSYDVFFLKRQQCGPISTYGCV